MIKAKEVLESESKCSDLSSGMATWVTGVVFLCMCCLALFAWLGFAIHDCGSSAASKKEAPNAGTYTVAQAVPVGDDGFEMY